MAGLFPHSSLRDNHARGSVADFSRAKIAGAAISCSSRLTLNSGQQFLRTPITGGLWFLAKNKNAAAKRGFRDRRHQTNAALSQA